MFIKKLNIKGNLCIVQCDVCLEHRQIRYNSSLRDKNKHLCKNCSAKKAGREKTGKYTAYNKGGVKNPNSILKGSTYKNTHGYLETYLGLNHGFGNRKDKFVLQHRLIAELKIGRKLLKGELVHHVDNNRTNNQPDNLYVCPNISTHRKIHSNLEDIAFKLVEAGIIKFNSETGEYSMPVLEEILKLYSVKSGETYVLDVENMAILSQAKAKLEGATTIPLGVELKRVRSAEVPNS